MGSFIHLHTCYWAYRPFGSALLVAGYDQNLKTHQLYSIDHTGIVQRCFGAAIGKGKSSARTEVEKLDLSNLKCRDALKIVAKT
jgi:20S proteasome subunit alpha 7